MCENNHNYLNTCRGKCVQAPFEKINKNACIGEDRQLKTFVCCRLDPGKTKEI